MEMNFGINSQYQDEENNNININISNTLNQNFEDNFQNENNSKIDSNNISVIPSKETYNPRLISKTYIYNDSNEKIINEQKRCRSAFSKKSFTDKFEIMKLNVPKIRRWDCDPTAEIIIHNLEQKIDVLAYQNFLLNKNIKELCSNNKELQNKKKQKNILLNAKQYINDEYININKNFIKNEKKKKNIDYKKEIVELSNENIRLKKENEILSEDNIGLNNIIEELNKNKKLLKIKFNEELEKYKRLLKNKDLNNNELNYKINNELINKNNSNIQIEINEVNTNNELNKNDNINFDIDKYLLIENEYKQLLNENEKLHLKIKNLLSVNDDETNQYSDSFLQNNIQNIHAKNKEDIINNSIIINNPNDLNGINNNITNEELIKENILLKEKIDELNNEINKINNEQNIKLSKIQKKLNENELIEETNIFNENNKNEELDKLLNEAISMNINENDEEIKKMLISIENIKDKNKKRISQCLIINNKLKKLIDENYLLNNKLSKMNTVNNNINNNPTQEPQTCFCEDKNKFSYDNLINLLKQKDEIIQKYKDKEEENEIRNRNLMIENNILIESNNSMKRDNNITNLRVKSGIGFENLVGKIVQNQKQVLGEREPRFKYFGEEENNHNLRYNNNFQYKNKRNINED